LCPPAEEGIARARTTADPDMGMADPDIDRHLGIPHAQEYVAATYTPADDRVVDDLVMVTAAVDVPAVIVTAVGIAVTKHPLYGERATSDGWPFLRSAISDGLAHFTVGVNKSATVAFPSRKSHPDLTLAVTQRR
jgi:hypothetical protein